MFVDHKENIVGRFLGGLHGGYSSVKYNDCGYILNNDFFVKPIGGLGGGVHVGGDWSSADGVYLAAFLGYTYTGISKTKNIDDTLAKQSMTNSLFFDVNIGGGHTSCFYGILGIMHTKEMVSLEHTALYLQSKLSMTIPRFGLGGRFMLTNNLAMSVNGVAFLSPKNLWEKRSLTVTAGGVSHVVTEAEKEAMGFKDGKSSADRFFGYQLSIGVSYALPVRAVF